MRDVTIRMGTRMCEWRARAYERTCVMERRQDFGFQAVEGRVSINDLHATLNPTRAR